MGDPVPRREDARLLTGKGLYSDDVNAPGQLHAAVLRSPHAHARIGAIDAAAALAFPGTVAVLTAADLAEDGIGGIPHGANPLHATDVSRAAFEPEHGATVFDEPQPVLAAGRVRHVGEAVALVVAETAAAAREAAELVDVEYEALPAVVGVLPATAEGAPLLHEGAPGNLGVVAELGDAAATEAAFARAAHVVEHRFVNKRIVNAQMEPRAALGEFDAASGVCTLRAGGQGVMRQRMQLAAALGMPPASVRVVSGDVGGGFGPRTMLYPEFVLAVWAAKRLGRSVKWSGDRSEAFVSDYQARDLVTDAAMAFDADGRALAMRVRLLGNAGAYSVSYVPLSNGAYLTTTVYDIPAVHVRILGAMTNTVPTCPYRGAGRPEAVHTIERLFDLAAARLGLDRVEIRRRNLIPPSGMPRVTPTGLPYDCGEFETVMDKAIALGDWAGFEARRAGAERRGRLRGIGIANYVESPVGAPVERVEVTVDPAGRLRVVAGTQSTGQGHETSFAQAIGHVLGVDYEAVDLVTGDTDIVRGGGGTHSDRSMRIAGTLMVRAGEAIVEQGKQVAAQVLEAALDDIEFADGAFRVAGTDRRLTLFEAAGHAPDGLGSEQDFRGRIPAFPNGCAVAEVEIDPDTGELTLCGYATIDDPGTVINPLIVEGQTHGGIAQGAGQAMREDCIYDAESGQMLTGSFMDYGPLRADDLPSFRVAEHVVPSPGNPLGVKGGGEGGITPALAVIVNAAVDALSPCGVTHLEMPLTPERLWRAMQGGAG
ncbi:MAG: molybdopterin-dependent oxidoreductase [Alphaproteobacteria bacterium]|nr:molybdopterin-dependent oxidoreductase [Alphaproteobacteria bacterium]